MSANSPPHERRFPGSHLVSRIPKVPSMGSPKKYSPRHTVSAGLASTLVFALTGCGRSPSFNVLGSYFPGWIACMVASILVTALIRFVLNRLQWEQQVPALPLFYFSIALLIACLIWLITFE